ncbi:hypothetical protein BO78DRAFT_436455, partial [Aspergillus sclerotiicarbonarius CBS 121057]
MDFITDYGAGPFNIALDMEDWFNRNLAISQQAGQAPATTPPFLFDNLVITHQDISPRNLIIGADGKVWLISWGSAGIYPVGMDAATLVTNRDSAPLFTYLLFEKIPKHEKFLRQLRSITYALT